MNTAYNTMIAKLIASLKGQIASKEQIFKDHVQGLYDVSLTPQEMREYISLAEFEKEDSGDYFMSFTLLDLEPFTSKEREAFCGKYNTVTVGIWIDQDLCKDVNTDNGICDEEAWQYTWHGN
jgi:hypothetical protein